MPSKSERNAALHALFGVINPPDGCVETYRDSQEKSIYECIKEMSVLFQVIEDNRNHRLELKDCFAHIHTFNYLLSRYSEVVKRDHILQLQVWFYALLADVISSHIENKQALSHVSTFLTASIQALGQLSDEKGTLS